MVKKTKKTINTQHSDDRVILLEKKVSELDESYKRVLADYQNLERRAKEQESQIVKFASAALLEKILISLDQLELAQNHLKDKGLEMVISSFLSTLNSEGLELIKTDHEIFDPMTMDCVEVVPGKKDVVTETLSKGYLLFDKVLRPAKVKVGSGETHSH